MSKVLVLAEKPSVGRDIARVLQCNKKGNGYLEGKRYIVTWALGHLVELAEPEVYDERYKSWRMEDLPMLPSPLKLSVIKQSGKQFHAVKKQISRRDVTEIVIATDAGREGELVARWILQKARVKKRIKRLWISSVTDQAIKQGFQRLKDGREYENLFASAVARAESDWYVGMNATRALTCKYNAQLSCGRVQTPTLAIIAQREREIKQFKPRPYYGIAAEVEGFRLIWQDRKSKDTKVFAKETCDRIYEGLRNRDAEVTDVQKKPKKSFAPPLYDLTELQRDAHKRFGFSAKETLSLTQRLYEHHKLVTYPRTDSRYLSEDIVPTLKDRIRACKIQPYAALASRALQMPIKPRKSFVDDRKVSDHHAIIPTEETAFLQELSAKERKIYDLIVKRFLAVLFPPFEYEQVTVQTAIGEERFVASGRNIKAPGWKEVYGLQADEDIEDTNDVSELQSIPDLKKGQRLNVRSLKQTKGETQPPKPFDEASLLSAMENPTKYMAGEDRDLIRTIGKTGGLGTVATRADIIEKLFSGFLIEKRGKGIFLTSKGRQLLDLVPDDLKSPALTAEWEQKLELIARGKLKKETFIEQMKTYAGTIVREIKNSDRTFKHDNLTATRCPECQKFMLEVKSKKGKMLVCQDRECGYRKHLSKITNARCPECRKKMELVGEGEQQKFICRCGHKESMAAFKERRAREKQKATKGEVRRYLKEQQQENEPVNTALADALAKWKKQQ